MRRSFPLHDLGNDEFQTLVACICREILGTGTIVFATGKDGGRDARFEGCAQRFPSAASPLIGRFIIQAKHTANPVASISDADFTRDVKTEAPKIKQLVNDGELEHYMVFTNRKVPANALVQLEANLKALGPKTVHVLGIEQIRDYLTLHTHIWQKLGFDRFDFPLRIQTQDITTTIRAFHAALKAEEAEPDAHFPYVPKPQKNKINKLSDAYFDEILARSLPHFAQIEGFLKNPRNDEYRNFYEDTADEIRRKLIGAAGHFTTFDEAMTHIIDIVTTDNPDLEGRRRFAAVFLHYMYYTCDIGQHVDTVQTS